MEESYQLIMKGNEVSILKDDNEIITLAKGVGIVAMSIYNSAEQYTKAKSTEEKQRLEEKVNFQSKCLDSMSRALTAVRPYVS